MKQEVSKFIFKIITYALLFGGIKALELDRLIIALTSVLNAISKSI